MQCVVFRCSKKQEMYLYVPHQEDAEKQLAHLPEALLKITGHLEKVMDLELGPERKLARADVNEVMVALADKGFYLQAPPNALLKNDDSMLHQPSDGF